MLDIVPYAPESSWHDRYDTPRSHVNTVRDPAA